MLQEAGREDIPSGTNPWCCTLDADIPLLLTVEEEEHYLERSLKAAANSCADLVPCPQANCEGVAVAGPGETGLRLACIEVQLCRAVSANQTHAGHSGRQLTLQAMHTASVVRCVLHYNGRGS